MVESQNSRYSKCYFVPLFSNKSNDGYYGTAAAARIVIQRRRRRREQHQRDIWARQWLLNRIGEREISNFVDYELRDDMLGFHSFLRMGSTEFNEILEAIAEDIMRMDTVIRDSVTPKERLVVTLRYLASGKPCNVQMLVIMTINVNVKYCDVRTSCQGCMHKKSRK